MHESELPDMATKHEKSGSCDKYVEKCTTYNGDESGTDNISPVEQHCYPSLDVRNIKVWQTSSGNAIQQSVKAKTSLDSETKKERKSSTNNKKGTVQKTSTTRLKSNKSNEEKILQSEPFCCEKCKSPYVVNPARAHSSNKIHRPRKIVDPETKQQFKVCNACRLSFTRPKRLKLIKKQKPPDSDAKNRYREECVTFSTSLVESLKDVDAARLYCPSFVLRPCQCLQNYITEEGIEGRESRAHNLLNIVKKAKHLRAQKYIKDQQDSLGRKGIITCKSLVFEEFVLETRGYLRTHMKLCERACQRVLMYSNNFLHKHLKSSPNSSRIQRLGGGNNRCNLKPISELSKEVCCKDRCVLLALTHSRLLEEWRRTARQSQREARRVLAEMLTPSGGSKANCYKFIKMVTGCSHTTICVVNDHMKKTQGNREPPEHGLRRWWREHGRKKRKSDLAKSLEEGHESSKDEDSCLNLDDVRIPSLQELQTLDIAEAGRCLEKQHQKLLSVQRHLANQQKKLSRLQDSRPALHGCCSPQSLPEVMSTPTEPPVTLPQQSCQEQRIVHILEIPASSTPVITSVPEHSHQGPAISVLTASGELEPLAISVNMAPSQSGNVIFIPEYETLQTTPDTPANNMVYTTNVVDLESVQLQVSQQQPPVHMPSLQLHLPLDIPLQLSVQPGASGEPVPLHQSSSQPVSYFVPQPIIQAPPQTIPSTSTVPIVSATSALSVVNSSQYVPSSDLTPVCCLNTVNCISTPN